MLSISRRNNDPKNPPNYTKLVDIIRGGTYYDYSRSMFLKMDNAEHLRFSWGTWNGDFVDFNSDLTSRSELDIFDKSNTDIWENLDVTYYDSSLPYKWHKSELTYEYMRQHWKTAYQNRLFFRMFEGKIVVAGHYSEEQTDLRSMGFYFDIETLSGAYPTDFLVQYLDGEYRVNSDGVNEFIDNRPQVKNSSDRKPENGKGYQFDGTATVEFDKADIDLSGATYVDFEFDAIKEAGEIVAMQQYSDASHLFGCVLHSNNRVYMLASSGSIQAYGSFEFLDYGKHTFRFKYIGSGSGNIDKIKIYVDNETTARVLTFADTIPTSLPIFTDDFQFGKHATTSSTGQLSNVIQRDINGSIIHKWNCDEAEGSITYDSADTLTPADGTITNATLSTFHTEDIRFASELNRIGYATKSTLTGVYIPLKSDNTPVVADCDVIYTGECPNNAKIVGANYVEFTGIEYLTLVLTGSETVTSSIGTSTPSISANRIDFTAGTMEYLVLSSGEVFTFATGYGTTVEDKSGNGNHGTLHNITMSSFYKNDTTGKVRPSNLIDGCDVWELDSDPTKLMYVPFDNNGSSIKTDGDTIAGYTWLSRNPQTAPAGKLYHNGCEATIENYKVPALYKADLEMKFLYGVELVTNGNFDTGITSWTNSSSGVISWEDKTILCESTTISSMGGATQTLSLTVGKSYIARCKYKNTSGLGGKFCIMNNAFTAFIAQTDYILDTSWVDLELEFVATETNNIIYLREKGNGTIKGEGNYDDIIVKEVTDDTPYPIPYDEIDYDKYDKHRLFANAEEKAKRDIMLYSKEQTGYDYTRLIKYTDAPPVNLWTDTEIWNDNEYWVD